MYRIAWSSQKVVYALWGAFISFTQGVHNAMIALLICILADTITGFIAAPHRGQVRKSARLGAFVGKIISYFLAGLLVFIVEQWTFPSYMSGTELTKLVFMACAMLEVYSVFENLGDITGLRIFKIITQFSIKKISEKVGMDVSELAGKDKKVEKN